MPAFVRGYLPLSSRARMQHLRVDLAPAMRLVTAELVLLLKDLMHERHCD